MLQVKKQVTPILADIMHEIISVAETSGWVMNPQSLIMFMSHGASFLHENQRLFEQIIKIFED